MIQKLSQGLSREVWIVQAGIFLNMLGYGAVLPFEVIYLNHARGFSLAAAGAIVGSISFVALAATPMAGPVIDRFGARAGVISGAIGLAIGYVGLALAQTPALALTASAAAGVGNGLLIPSQAALLAALTGPEMRHRATAVSRVAGNGGYGVGGVIGGFVAAAGLTGFIALYLLNAATYVVYAGVLVSAVHREPRAEPTSGGYRVVIRDRGFIRLGFANVIVMAVGFGFFSWILPPYARDHLGVRPQLLGLLFLVNVLTVVTVQLPVAKFIEGKRRVASIATACALFGSACLLALAADFVPHTFGYATVLAASIIFAVGECFHLATLMPLVADMAPPELRGRYMAAMGLSWWLGLGLAPTIGTLLLGISPIAAFAGGAAAVLAAGLSMIPLEAKLPQSIRLTPAPLKVGPVSVDGEINR